MDGYNKLTLRAMVRSAYMLQSSRIVMGNRIAANFKIKLGIKPGESEDATEDKEAKKTLKKLKVEYSRLTDGIVAKRGIPTKKAFEPLPEGIISDYVELLLMNQYVRQIHEEEQVFKDIKVFLEKFPIWTEFMQDIPGIGPAIAGIIISEIDISKAKYASSLHKYCGLDVVITDDGTGEARGRKKHHLVDSTYIDSEGHEQTKKGLSYKPFLKTKLLGVLAGSFLKAGASDKNKYEKCYRNYKHRILNDPRHKEKTKAHINNMALRYAVKMFIIDLYAKWRELEGLEVFPPYHEAKLGLKHKE